MNSLPLPILLFVWAGATAFIAWHLIRGLVVGRIKFFIRPPTPEFDRTESPVGYWLTVVWDTVIAAAMLLSSWFLAVAVLKG